MLAWSGAVAQGLLLGTGGAVIKAQADQAEEQYGAMAAHNQCWYALSRPKGRQISWKYQSGLLPKFPRVACSGAAAQGPLRAARCPCSMPEVQHPAVRASMSMSERTASISKGRAARAKIAQRGLQFPRARCAREEELNFSKGRAARTKGPRFLRARCARERGKGPRFLKGALRAQRGPQFLKGRAARARRVSISI